MYLVRTYTTVIVAVPEIAAVWVFLMLSIGFPPVLEPMIAVMTPDTCPLVARLTPTGV